MKSRGRLLIVDDEKDIVENLMDILEDVPEEIICAYDGKEALELLSSEEIHCVLCDINMPKLTGDKLLKEAREQGITVPFIIYTGHGDIQLRDELIPYGIYEFLNKPHLDGLHALIEDCIQMVKEENPIDKKWVNKKFETSFTRKLIDY